MKKVYFVSGIDTGCGKTIVTGLIARQLLGSGVNVITQKLVQTGSSEIADDILEHRRLMGIDLLEVDREKLTCPYVFNFPASPHLSARLENVTIDCNKITQATRELCKTYELVLLEGAGGLFVPLNDHQLTIDYLQEMQYPLVLVTSSKLGSINHTLMGLEVCKSRIIPVKALVYNHYPNKNELIINESRNVFKKYLEENSPGTALIDCPTLESNEMADLNLDGIF